MATPSASLPDLAGRRILVVDDHADTREMLRFVFEDAGAEVRTCGSPEECHTALATSAYDVVITDLAFDGDRQAGIRIYDVARRQIAGALVIALTGRVEAEDELRAMGFDAVLVKPVDPFHLVVRMAGMLAGQARS